MLEKVKAGINKGILSASVSSGTYLEIEKIKGKIENEKKAVENALDVLGRNLYQHWKEKTLESLDIDQHCMNIESHYANIYSFQLHIKRLEEEKNKILEHVSYSFEKGKIYAVVGASGSGKTTTLSLSSGLDKPDEGKVLFKGKDIQEIGLNKYRREDISIVFQSYNLIYYMNALENVMSALEIAGIKRKDKKEYCLSILEQLGLSKDECKRDIRQLSGGQQQRVAIARAIAREVDLILCDEPTGNLDEKNSIEIMNTFLDLAHIHHKCVILVTHSPTLAKMCDVSLKIKEGKIEAKR